jgi:hypothetical protein
LPAEKNMAIKKMMIKFDKTKLMKDEIVKKKQSKK